MFMSHRSGILNDMTVHEMKLNPSPFDMIRKGEKTIEGRLNDEKRQQIQIGDQIIFKKLPKLTEELLVKVTKLFKYPTFRAMFEELPSEAFGAPGWTVDELVEAFYKYYTLDEEVKYGVVGIEIES